MRKRSSPLIPITHEDIDDAMEQFLDKGGHISVLPQQKVTTIKVIGAEKWDVYESIRDLTL